MLIHFSVEDYIASLQKLFEAHAQPANSAAMARYMRDQFPFLGIASPMRKALSRDFFKTHGYPPYHSVIAVVEQLWQMPEREYQYTALDMLDKMKRKIPDEIPYGQLLTYLITEKSWWDTVDIIAGTLAGDFLARYPEQRREYIDYWMISGNMWLQRSCLLFQLKYKKNTDIDLLTRCIAALQHSKEFFIQKAIGWALREYAKTNPQFVAQFVANSNYLAPLSRREALKHLAK